MAKSKIRKKPNPPPEAVEAKAKADSKQRIIKLAVIGVIVAAGGWWWSQNQNIESRFLENVQNGQGTLERVQRHADHGTSGHLTPGERISYGSNMPTSGRHDGRWVSPGFYSSVQAPTMLVHSLEHGLVVIYYDSLSEDDRETLEDWSDLYGGPFSGVVITPQPGLGDKVVLTAWRKSLTLDRFDADSAAVFIDAYRGRGPENPIR